jgi:hypothetical protein
MSLDIYGSDGFSQALSLDMYESGEQLDLHMSGLNAWLSPKMVGLTVCRTQSIWFNSFILNFNFGRLKQKNMLI